MSQRLATIPGIGIMTATALAASVGEGEAFRNGRQLAAYLGLVPRQSSSGRAPSVNTIEARRSISINRPDVRLQPILLVGFLLGERVVSM